MPPRVDLCSPKINISANKRKSPQFSSAKYWIKYVMFYIERPSCLLTNNYRVRSLEKLNHCNIQKFLYKDFFWSKYCSQYVTLYISLELYLECDIQKTCILLDHCTVVEL